MTANEKRIAGWREWISLPDLGVGEIKVKLDTGARTSALHAFDLETFSRGGAPWVRFAIHPMQRIDDFALQCEAPIIDMRQVTNSGGGSEKRYFIETTLGLGGEQWPIEISLTNRDQMGFRMLLGRTAMKGRLIVDPVGSYRLGKHKRKIKRKRLKRREDKE